MAVCQSRLSHSETAVCFLPTFALSLAGNNLTNYGRDKSGVIALAAALKDSKITHLEYVCPSSASHALCFLGYGTEPAVTLLKLLMPAAAVWTITGYAWIKITTSQPRASRH